VQSEKTPSGGRRAAGAKPSGNYDERIAGVSSAPSGNKAGRRIAGGPANESDWRSANESGRRSGYESSRRSANDSGRRSAGESGGIFANDPGGLSTNDPGVRYEPSFGSILAAEIKPDRVEEIAGRLAEILENEALLYKDANDISAKKTDVIVRGKIEDLDCLVKAEQAIILKIGKLEDERERIVEALSDELELDLEGATLSDIGSYFNNDSYNRLNICHESLSRILGDLKHSNETNSQLIQNALDYVNFSVNLIATNRGSSGTYTHDGGEGAEKQRRSVFDVRR
jgi:flagellar biosynthesis/type III secretory pathway chaperone